MNITGSVRKEHQRICIFCANRKVPPGRFFYCSTKCSQRAQNKRRWQRIKDRPKDGSSKRNRKIIPRGRLCQWCKARDDEVTFTSKTACEACEKRAQIYGICMEHKQLKHKDGCYECEPPHNQIKVLIFDGSSERRRYIWRTIRNGCVAIGRRWRVIAAWPVEFVLSRDIYVVTRA